MNISFLTSGHEPFDDRIFYHMARSLSDKNENVEIVSSKCQLTEVTGGIKLNCIKAGLTDFFTFASLSNSFHTILICNTSAIVHRNLNREDSDYHIQAESAWKKDIKISSWYLENFPNSIRILKLMLKLSAGMKVPLEDP